MAHDRFIYDINSDRMINMDYVREIRSHKNGSFITFADGSTIRLEGFVNTDYFNHVVVPAQAGFSVVIYLKGNPPGYMTDPVIAWSVGLHGATPLTIDGTPNFLSNAWAVLRPDGKVDVPNDTMYHDINDWMKALAEPVEHSHETPKKPTP